METRLKIPIVAVFCRCVAHLQLLVVAQAFNLEH